MSCLRIFSQYILLLFLSVSFDAHIPGFMKLSASWLMDQKRSKRIDVDPIPSREKYFELHLLVKNLKCMLYLSKASTVPCIKLHWLKKDQQNIDLNSESYAELWQCSWSFAQQLQRTEAIMDLLGLLGSTVAGSISTMSAERKKKQYLFLLSAPKTRKDKHRHTKPFIGPTSLSESHGAEIQSTIRKGQCDSVFLCRERGWPK